VLALPVLGPAVLGPAVLALPVLALAGAARAMTQAAASAAEVAAPAPTRIPAVHLSRPWMRRQDPPESAHRLMLAAKLTVQVLSIPPA
jgi:hypothetical protein